MRLVFPRADPGEKIIGEEKEESPLVDHLPQSGAPWEGYEMEKLSEDMGVCVSKEHRFGTDAFLLADFAAPRHKDTVCDLGTGCGIIPMILTKHFSPKRIYGVEVQEKGYDQFCASVAYSGLREKVIPVLGDLRSLQGLPFGSFDLVTCNPPYKIAGGGILSENKPDQIARHETMCTLDDVCAAGARLLRFGGRLCICQRPERLTDAMCSMRSAGIEPKRLRFVSKEPSSAPWLFLLEGKKGAKPFLQALPPLFTKGEAYPGNENGFSEELLQIYSGRG